MWIYPGVLKRKFSLEITEVYELLHELEEKGILQSLKNHLIFARILLRLTCEMPK